MENENMENGGMEAGGPTGEGEIVTYVETEDMTLGMEICAYENMGVRLECDDEILTTSSLEHLVTSSGHKERGEKEKEREERKDEGGVFSPSSYGRSISSSSQWTSSSLDNSQTSTPSLPVCVNPSQCKDVTLAEEEEEGEEEEGEGEEEEEESSNESSSQTVSQSDSVYCISQASSVTSSLPESLLESLPESFNNTQSSDTVSADDKVVDDGEERGKRTVRRRRKRRSERERGVAGRATRDSNMTDNNGGQSTTFERLRRKTTLRRLKAVRRQDGEYSSDSSELTTDDIPISQRKKNKMSSLTLSSQHTTHAPPPKKQKIPTDHTPANVLGTILTDIPEIDIRPMSLFSKRNPPKIQQERVVSGGETKKKKKEKKETKTPPSKLQQQQQQQQTAKKTTTTTTTTTTVVKVKTSSSSKRPSSNHHKILMSWQRDYPLGLLATRAPVLYALDNIPDKLNAVQGEWMNKAKLIWTTWRRTSVKKRYDYCERAKLNRLKLKERSAVTDEDDDTELIKCEETHEASPKSSTPEPIFHSGTKPLVPEEVNETTTAATETAERAVVTMETREVTETQSSTPPPPPPPPPAPPQVPETSMASREEEGEEEEEKGGHFSSELSKTGSATLQPSTSDRDVTAIMKAATSSESGVSMVTAGTGVTCLTSTTPNVSQHLTLSLPPSSPPPNLHFYGRQSCSLLSSPLSSSSLANLGSVFSFTVSPLSPPLLPLPSSPSVTPLSIATTSHTSSLPTEKSKSSDTGVGTSLASGDPVINPFTPREITSSNIRMTSSDNKRQSLSGPERGVLHHQEPSQTPPTNQQTTPTLINTTTGSHASFPYLPQSSIVTTFLPLLSSTSSSTSSFSSSISAGTVTKHRSVSDTTYQSGLNKHRHPSCNCSHSNGTKMSSLPRKQRQRSVSTNTPCLPRTSPLPIVRSRSSSYSLTSSSSSSSSSASLNCLRTRQLSHELAPYLVPTSLSSLPTTSLSCFGHTISSNSSSSSFSTMATPCPPLSAPFLTASTHQNLNPLPTDSTRVNPLPTSSTPINPFPTRIKTKTIPHYATAGETSTQSITLSSSARQNFNTYPSNFLRPNTLGLGETKETVFIPSLNSYGHSVSPSFSRSSSNSSSTSFSSSCVSGGNGYRKWKNQFGSGESRRRLNKPTTTTKTTTKSTAKTTNGGRKSISKSSKTSRKPVTLASGELTKLSTAPLVTTPQTTTPLLYSQIPSVLVSASSSSSSSSSFSFSSSSSSSHPGQVIPLSVTKKRCASIGSSSSSRGTQKLLSRSRSRSSSSSSSSFQVRSRGTFIPGLLHNNLPGSSLHPSYKWVGFDSSSQPNNGGCGSVIPVGLSTAIPQLPTDLKKTTPTATPPSALTGLSTTSALSGLSTPSALTGLSTPVSTTSSSITNPPPPPPVSTSVTSSKRRRISSGQRKPPAAVAAPKLERKKSINTPKKRASTTKSNSKSHVTEVSSHTSIPHSSSPHTTISQIPTPQSSIPHTSIFHSTVTTPILSNTNPLLPGTPLTDPPIARPEFLLGQSLLNGTVHQPHTFFDLEKFYYQNLELLEQQRQYTLFLEVELRKMKRAIGCRSDDSDKQSVTEQPHPSYQQFLGCLGETDVEISLSPPPPPLEDGGGGCGQDINSNNDIIAFIETSQGVSLRPQHDYYGNLLGQCVTTTYNPPEKSKNCDLTNQ